VARVSPQDGRGFFIAAALNFTVGASYGWRVMFLCGGAPVLLSFYMLSKLREPDRWTKAAGGGAPHAPLKEIFRPSYRRRTLVNAALVTISIIGLWAGAVYEPSAIVTLAKHAGHSAPEAVRLASFGTALLSIGTCLGCLAVPILAERFGRRATLAVFFAGMAICIWLSFGWAFYAGDDALALFIGSLFLLGFFGGNFAMYSLWLPEQYSTAVRATAFAFVTSFGRFIGAGVNFLIGAGVHSYGSIGVPVAATALAFLFGLAVLPFGYETRGAQLPD
jgi:MFS family permease